MSLLSTSKHTLNIFERLYRVVHPVTPSEIRQEVEKALDDLKKDLNISLEDAEKALIRFGKKLWPYRKALLEYIREKEDELGIKILNAKLDPGLKRKVECICADGGTFKDIYRGVYAKDFESHEMAVLKHAFVDIANELRAHAAQMAHSTHQNHFLERVKELREILDFIETQLKGIRQRAETEPHEQLANEMRDYAKAFEYGLCMLGPEVHYSHLNNTDEYFNGRKHEILMFGL